MDDVNINEICLDGLDVEEGLDGGEDDWVKLSWINNQSSNDGSFQLPKTWKDLDNEMVQTTDDSKVFCTNTESEDISDGISVITESDVDAVNTNLFQICQYKPRESPQMLDIQISRQKNIWNTLFACVLGIIIGLSLSQFFIFPETCSVSSRVDAESLKTASHNIVNTCKELADGKMKTMLNEIKAHIPTDKIITEQFLMQFSKITNSSDKTNGKPVMVTKELFNSTSHPLDQLQMSLHVLSSLTFIYDDNSFLKNDINKTLNIVNNIKAFYDTLVSFTNNRQDAFDPVVLNFLQHNSNKMYITSKSLLSDLVEKISKVTSKVYNKCVKERYRLNKKLCHLKSIISDDEFLKQLTETNELFKDYDKSCFSNYTSKNLDDRTAKENTKNVKKNVTKTDDTVLYAKYDKKNTYKIYDNNKENSSKNKRNTRQNVDKSTMKFLRNTSHKIYNTSQLLLSKVVENTIKLKHQLSKKLHYLKNILPSNSKFLKQLIQDDEDNKESDKCCDEKNDDLQSNVPKNSYDNILMQLKNACPLSTSYCPKFNISMTSFDSIPNHKTKNYEHKKHDTNNKRTVMDYENSAKILSGERKSKSKKKDYFKSNESTKKVINDQTNYEEKNKPQNKIKNHIPEHTVNYHKSKHSSFDSRTMRQDNQHYTDKKSDRSHEYKKQRQPNDSDWYFRRAYSRRNARRRVQYMHMYQ